jgi:3-isopropylmalate/(R)-2-methylmalate dehydratase small subunit
MSNFAHRLSIQDDINTDYIISGRYKFSVQDPGELAGHIFEDIDEGFPGRVKAGDFLVVGDNFGCGSSREQAPVALKASGLKAVIAKSYARIFYRNAFNVGLCLIECETNYIDDMDEIEIDMDRHMVRNLSKGVNVEMKPLPKIMRTFLDKGGVVEYFKEYGRFREIG